jgi:hypothetical protein
VVIPGGLELKAFAEAHSGWNFDEIDPVAEMLKLAKATSEIATVPGTLDLVELWFSAVLRLVDWLER